MKNPFCWTFVAFVGLIPALQAESIDNAALDQIVQEALAAWHVPGVAVGIVHNDQVVFLKGYGSKRQGSKEPITPETLFPIASCTKAFTTTAMAMLVDEGKMNWDDPVRKYVPFFHLADPLADAQVTLRDLVSHRTGLGNNDLLWYRSPWSRDEIIRRIGKVPLKYPFRSTFQYQSTMVTTAGIAVETASQSHWEDFVQKRIFDPLGIQRAVFTSTAAERAADHATPHLKNREGVPQPVDWYPLKSPDPAGSICIGARDLCQWVRFQLGDGRFDGQRLVSAKNLQETHTPQTIIRLEGSAREMNPETLQMSYGMGWVIQDYRGQLIWSHAGAIDGFRAPLTLVPEAKLGLVLLNNLHGTSMNLALSNQLVDHLLGLSKKNWNRCQMDQVKKGEAAAEAKNRQRQAARHPGTQPSHPLPDYVGTYEHPGYGEATVALENGKLGWKYSVFTGELQHYHYDFFTIANDFLGRPQIQFTLNRSGAVESMKVLDVLEVEFKKVAEKNARP
jgi:CubicO group peptidase (beta-lactamase class C family)